MEFKFIQSFNFVITQVAFKSHHICFVWIDFFIISMYKSNIYSIFNTKLLLSVNCVLTFLTMDKFIIIMCKSNIYSSWMLNSF